MPNPKKPKNQTKPQLPEWLARVVKERDDLQKKLSKLCMSMDTSVKECKFLDLPLADRILLKNQYELMTAYRDVLDVRLALHGVAK